MTLHARSELLAAPRKKLLYRFLAASVRHATPASLFLYAAAVLGLLALPLVVKDNYLDENALLAGSAVPRIRNSGALQSAADVQQRLKHAGNSANSGALQGTANDTSTTLLLELNGALEAAGFDQAQAGQLFGAAAAHAVMQYLASVPWLAKDVVWVLPDAGCGQMHSLQVWLEEAANGKWQRHASPFGRAGLMQQALVLDVASPSFNALEVHTIGFSGQLPMLDLYYLVAFLAEEHVGLPPAMKDLFGRPLAGRQTGYATKLGTMLRFVAQQALTRPSGVHAAFKEYGVDAVTLRTVLLPEKEALPAAEGLARLATLLELALRSCNNLLERLHHSVLLYLQVSPHAFVSVQAYIGPLVALLLILPLQAAASKRRAEGLLSAHALTGHS
ncbi:hypothetical protein WJX72_007042 [[Myrmecia] bisecta]|uniref:Uncharacterized protein n=1 Tax=[Myrmecia] bisecta TaxID=41462 RepID=A0AAW1PB08_9CHLO